MSQMFSFDEDSSNLLWPPFERGQFPLLTPPPRKERVMLVYKGEYNTVDWKGGGGGESHQGTLLLLPLRGEREGPGGNEKEKKRKTRKTPAKKEELREG